MNDIDQRHLIDLMLSVPVTGPVLDVRLIPEPIRSEMLSGYDMDAIAFPEGDAPLCIYAVNFALWCGIRLLPNFSVTNYKRFPVEYIESLSVRRVAPRTDFNPKAVFKPGAFIINLMAVDNEERFGRVAFGEPYQDRFELRYCEWICTSLVISKYAADDKLVVYTKSGSEYILQYPFSEVDLPFDYLPFLMRGFGPDHVRIIELLKSKGLDF